MATAVATVSLTDERFSWSAGNKYFVLGKVAIGASPLAYATGGLVMNMLIPLIKASRTPLSVHVFGQSGYVYKYIPGTDASNGKLEIFVQDGTSGNPLAEMADTTAIPAAVSGDTIQFVAIFHGQE